DDQRERLVINGTVQAPLRLQVSGMLQAYSSLPMNITSGVTTIQGTAGRPIVNGQFITRNAGALGNFFSANVRISRTFRVAGRVDVAGLMEGVNLCHTMNIL